jgi:phosphomannomutase
MGLIISISGLRGLVPEELTPQVACTYAAAFGGYLISNYKQGPIKVCVGRDTRPSSQMLAASVLAGLAGVGVDLIDLGVVATPTVGVMVRHLGCKGGVVVTASHNGPRYNGIKLLSSEGMALRGTAASQVQDRYRANAILWADASSCGRMGRNYQSDAVHLEKVLAIVDRSQIASRAYKVVLDSVNGAGGRPGRRLLKALGCKVKVINGAPTGAFARGPEPVSENLEALCRQVRSWGADIGFAQDPDADRLAIVDADGCCLGEEYTLALAVSLVLNERPGPVAINLSTSRMVEDLVTAAGCRLIRTPVGEANVASAMIDHGCVIGGEGNGGVIDLRVGPVRDSLVGMALVLQLMARTGKTIRGLAEHMGRYVMTKRRYTVPQADAARIIDRIKGAFDGAKVDLTDGLRCKFDDGWFHLRPSNTEPVLRLVAEAKDKGLLDSYIARIEGLLADLR